MQGETEIAHVKIPTQGNEVKVPTFEIPECHNKNRSDIDEAGSGWTAEAAVPTYAVAQAVGRVKRKVLPWPSSLSARMEPPWASMMCLAIARPRPVPPDSRERALSTR